MTPLQIGLLIIALIAFALWLRAKLHDPNFRRIKVDDLLVAQAKIEAQASLDKFLVLHAQNPENCSVKVALPCAAESFEHIWVDSLKPGNETEDWSGALANDPKDLKGLKFGSPVTFPQADIEDWMVLKDDGFEGGYSLPAVLR